MAIMIILLLLLLNIDITLAVNYGATSPVGLRSKDKDANGNPPLTDTRKHFLRSYSSLKAPPAKRQLIGSSAPDCGHTCGACSPCKIQISSYECSDDFGSHAEACPLGYFCICHGKSFPIP